MTYNEVLTYARKYYQLDLAGQKEVIRKVWVGGRMDGLMLLAQMIGVQVSYLYNYGRIKQLKQERNRARRQRKRQRANAMDITEIVGELSGGVLHNTGGKRTTWKTGDGNIRSASSGQAWSALTGN